MVGSKSSFIDFRLTRALRLIIVIVIMSVVTLATLRLSGTASASGDASFSLSPASGSYTTGSTIVLSISETSSSGDNTNAVQANLSYPASLQYVSTSLTGPFTLCGQETGGSGSINIGCAATSAQSGTQAIAQVTFTVASTGTASVAMTSGSNIDNTGGTSVWNGTLPSASYSLSAPVSSGGGSSSGGSGGGTTTTTTTTKPAATTTTTATKSTATATNPATSITTTTSTPATTAPTTTTTNTPAVANAILEVTVTNSKGQPINNAKVVIDNRYSENTNAQGKAGFSSLVVGKHSVTVYANGKKTTQTSVALTPTEDKTIALKLANNSLPATGALIAIIAVAIIVVYILALRLIRIRRDRSGSMGYAPVESAAVVSSSFTPGSTPPVNNPSSQTQPQATTDTQPTVIAPDKHS